MARRRGKKIATTAVARKLLTRAFHLLTDADAAQSHRRIHKASGTPATARTTTNNTSTTSGIRRTRARAGTVPNSG